ncbi:unnamed protein product [Sphagnum jensenii]|uniref:Trehalose 6-phosphate phosphatase n=1 Tax=Sphagnum jensenii TaxID=128206 RepID=A0ABP1AI96_9BRYO
MVLKLSRGGEIVPGADQKLSLEALFKHEDHSCAGDREVAAVEELLRAASFESNVIAAAAERTSLVAEAAATAVAAAMSTFIRSATTKTKYISTVCAAATEPPPPPPPLDSASSTPSSYSAAAQAMPILCRLQQKKHMINPAAYHATGADMHKQPGGHLLTWLDAMKAQSPPHFHSSILHASDHDHTLESPQSCTYDMQLRESAAATAAYTAWVKKQCPSAVRMFKKLMVQAKAKQVVVFLDYDGTLSPIVDDPDQAHMSDDHPDVSHSLLCGKQSWGALAEKVENVLKDYPTLNLTHGRKVLEIRPAIAWDKGKAVDFLLSSLGLADSNEVFPVYIGDDRTDEDAFKVLKDSKHGCGILVTSVPKETKASFSLRDPHEVMEFLLYLVRWKKQELDGVKNGSKTSPCI